MIEKRFLSGALLLVPFALAGCGSDSDSGTLSLRLTDAPVDQANRVVVEFTGVTLKPAGGQEIAFEFETPRQIDLLALQGGETELLLDDVVLDAGNYNWIRLEVNAGMNASDSFIELNDGGMHPLYIPSGNQTGLKLVRGFTVPANGSADFTIDFDLRKSVVDPQSQGTPYILKPALRLVDNTQVGAIEGSVDAALANAAGCAPAVYVYEDHDIAPDDVGSGNEPVASALVKMNDATGAFEYRVDFLLAGPYTVAFTCEADADAPDADDDIAFEAAMNAVVAVNETASADF